MARRLCVVVMLTILGTASASAQPQPAQVQGTVVDADGRPVAGAEIVLADPLGAILQAVTADAAGRFVLADVAPGRFTLRAAPAGRVDQAAALSLAIDAGLPLDVTLRLPPRVQDQVQVEGSPDVVSTRMSLAGASLTEVPVRMRGRFLQDAIATLPGWGTEDNGLLHARGVDDGFLYVVDGVPVYERLDTLNGLAPDQPSIGSINVVTGYVAPEFGYKAGGVIEVRSPSLTEEWRASGDVGAGSNATVEGGLMAGGAIGGGLALRLGGSSFRSDRFLDPVDPGNLHNDGSQGFTSGEFDYAGRANHRLKVGWLAGRARYDVPNAEEQDETGQDQRQRIANGSLAGSWERVWSDRTVMQMAGYYRRSSAELDGSDHDTPLFADSRRSLSRTGVLAGLTHQRGPHLLKAGFEVQGLSLEEDFTFFVTDEEEGEEAGLSEGALEHDEDDPFVFAGRDRPGLFAFYAQDTWQAGSRLTVGAGVRFDRSTLLLERYQWSPRAGASFRVADATVLRASVSRFFQPPQPEYVLLSSSEQARELSPFVIDVTGGGADLEPERQWAIEAGVEHRFRRWRLDAAYWRRDGEDMADPNVFVGTTIIFPNAVAKGRAQGFDVRVEMPRWRGWSGYFSSTVSKVVQTGPVTGGLFLEDDIEFIGPGVEFLPDHDQRAAIAAGATWTHPRSGLTAALSARYETGTPIQRDEEGEEELEERPGADLVDFDEGRVKPRFLVSLVAAVPIADTGRVKVALRGSLLNIFDQAYAYNFGNPFSGTHFGAPRTAAVSVQIDVR